MDDGFSMFMFLVVCIGLGLLIGNFYTGKVFQKQAIERGYAQYCPANGAWAWKGECRE